MSEVNKQTNITINGKLTVTVHLKDRPSRYGPADLKTEVDITFGASAKEIEWEIRKQLHLLRRRLMIACGQETIDDDRLPALPIEPEALGGLEKPAANES